MKKNKVNKLPDDIVRAIYREDLDVVKQWQTFENINSLDGTKRSPIFHAVLIRSKNMVMQLLKDKPSLNLKDKYGWYPLHYAAQDYMIDIAGLLVDNGADIECRDDYGNTPLWRATFASAGRGEMIKLLLLKGADPNNANDSGISPVKLATTISNYNITQFY